MWGRIGFFQAQNIRLKFIPYGNKPCFKKNIGR